LARKAAGNAETAQGVLALPMRLWIGVGLAVACGIATGGVAGVSSPRLLSPDLVQRPPAVLVVTASDSGGARRFRLGFLSSFENVGRGPLVIAGSRESVREPAMRADQLVRVEGGGWIRHRAVGSLRYVKAETHEHWHLLPFDVYELRPADSGRPLRAWKTGFCLSDQFRAGERVPQRPAAFLHECGRRLPGLLSLREGLSSGWGDYYVPTLEGQFFDVTALPAGDYVLVNTLNPGRLLLESDYANDSASVRLRLDWPGGRSAEPRVTVVRVCPGGSNCPGD
jgi:Lysyl oxidase